MDGGYAGPLLYLCSRWNAWGFIGVSVGIGLRGCSVPSISVFWIEPLAVRLEGSCPLMREACRLGKECGLVYGVLWEAAWHDQRGDCGGTTEMSHKALAEVCGLGKATVLRAVDLLLDDGLISCLGLTGSWGGGSRKRLYRVLHPSQVEAQRVAIDVMGEGLKPSVRAKLLRVPGGLSGDEA